MREKAPSARRYIGWFRAKDVPGGYRSPKWLLVLGTFATLLGVYIGIGSLEGIFAFPGVAV